MRKKQNIRPAVFLDRDGTINKEVAYLSSPDQLELLSGAARGIRLLREAGFIIVVVTNQSGVARGFFDEEKVRRVNKALETMLLQQGAIVDAWYYCPHHPGAGEPPYRKTCSCRKPSPGMVEQACRDLAINLSRSYVVGDNISDMGLARNCGTKAVLVRTGHGKKVLEKAAGELSEPVDFVAKDLLEAAKWICARKKSRGLL